MCLKKILKEKDLSMAWLSRRLGINRSTVAYWVRTNTTPNEKYFKSLAQALDLTEDEVSKMFVKKEK